jgi:hypothetical protein
MSALRLLRVALSTAILFSSETLTAGAGADGDLLTLIDSQGHRRIAPPSWPDVSLSGLRNLEARDQATLKQLHTIPRNELTPENRVLYDLLE